VRLLACLAAGVVPRVRGRVAGRKDVPRKSPRIRLPTRKSWLGGAIGWYGRGYALQIEHLLGEPETAALLAASPQAQRLLRPLCRMLGIVPAGVLPLPPRVRKPRPRPARKPKRLTRREREAILWYPNSEGRPMKLLPRRLPRD
jgi:hypothetical protein